MAKDKKNDNGFGIRIGRTSDKAFLITEFDIIDQINEYSSCETLGFYLSIKRYINRKEFNKQNEVNYTQDWLENQLGIGHSKYYRHLKTCFNVGLIDIEKLAIVKFFINYNIEGKKNPLVEKNILYFSTLENKSLWLKGNIENIIAKENPEIPLEFINVIEVKHKTNYIVHDYPPIDIYEKNNHKLIQYRDWDEEMNKFKRGEDREERKYKNDNQKDPSFQNGKDPSFQNGKDPSFQNGKENNIILASNSIIESSNSIINQSSKINFDRLNDLNEQIVSAGFKSYNDLIYDLQLEKTFYKYPQSEWINPTKKAIWEIYYFDDIKIRNRKIGRYDAISKLQNLTIDIIISAINKVIETSKNTKIKYPIAFLKTTLFNEIDEFEARVQAQVNYDLNNSFGNIEKDIDNIPEEENTVVDDGKDEDFTINLKKQTLGQKEENIKATEKYKNTEFYEPLMAIKGELTSASFDAFFDNGIENIQKDENIVKIKVKGGSFIKEILENRYLPLIEEHFSKAGIKEIKIIY